MKLRVFIFKPGEEIREPLSQYIGSLGHEVSIIHSPQTCLKYHTTEEMCNQSEICTDVMILGYDVPVLSGIEIIERRLTAGCKGIINCAILCESLLDEERLRIDAIGCQYFENPLQLSKIGDWLNEVHKKTPHDRTLAPFTIGGSGEMQIAKK